MNGIREKQSVKRPVGFRSQLETRNQLGPKNMKSWSYSDARALNVERQVHRAARGDLLPAIRGTSSPRYQAFWGTSSRTKSATREVAAQRGRRVAKQGEEVPAQQGRRSPPSSVNAGEEVVRKRRKLGEEVGQLAGRRWQLLGGGGRADGEEEDGQPSCDTRRIAHALRSRELPGLLGKGHGERSQNKYMLCTSGLRGGT